MHVADVKGGAFPIKASRAERAESSFVCQLGEGVRLIHKLRKLAGSEKLLNRRRHGPRVDQRLRRDDVFLLHRHTFPYNPFHSGQPNSELVLQKLSYRPDSSVAEMVNIVGSAQIILEI